MFDFAKEFQHPTGSPIRELFQFLSLPGMISFAGGYPAPATFDVKKIGECVTKALEQAPVDCLQYGATEGAPSLRKALSTLMGHRGAAMGVEHILITSGSQQGFDFVVKAFVEPGVRVLVEGPTYPAAIQAFRLAGAVICTIPTDGGGIRTDALEHYLQGCASEHKPRLLYLVRTFANPTGATLSLERRRHLLNIIEAHALVVVEDDPYGCLVFDEGVPPSLLALSSDREALLDRIVYLGILSKTVAPGLRIGWMVAHPDLIRRAVIAKQASDLCTPPWVQVGMALYLEFGHLESQVGRIIEAYRVKRDAMVQMLDRHLKDKLTDGVPHGGMFVWATLPDGFDSAELLKFAIEEKALFVPGKAFYTEHMACAALRLSFATPSCEAIEVGVQRLARAIQCLEVARVSRA